MTVTTATHPEKIICRSCGAFVGQRVGETYPDTDGLSPCCVKAVGDVRDSRYDGGYTPTRNYGRNTVARGSSEDGGDNPWGDLATRIMEDSR